MTFKNVSKLIKPGGLIIPTFSVPEAKYGSMKYFSLPFLLFLSSWFTISATAQVKIYPGFNDEINNRIAADSNSKINVVTILINGNKRTKSYIILREMRFKPGDSIIAAKLFEVMEDSRALIYNTTLFSQVVVTPIMVNAREIIVKVTVLEKLYIIPSPQFNLIDRNFNDWVKTYDADLKRVIYGVKFAHYNLSGRGDKLRIYLLNGYARTFSFSYSAPYSNGALTEGFSVAAGFTQNREINYNTSKENKWLLLKNEGFTRNQFNASATYQTRRGYFKKNIFSLSYNYIKVSDSVLLPQYNPNYFGQARSFVGFVDFRYSFQYSKTNNVNYPLQGKIVGFAAFKRGFGFTGGVNMLSLDANYSVFIPHNRNWYSSVELLGNVKLPLKQAYINQSSLGYRDFYLRGLEYYVIDAVATGISKYTLKKKIVAFDIPVPFNIRKIPVIPFTIYAKTYADMGYSYNKSQFNSRLGNRLLYTGGFGIDFLSLYDTTLKLEYSFNQLGENGLFLHARSLF